jgi:hypothetical protein
LRAKEAAEEKERNKSKNADSFLEVKEILARIGNLGSYWKDVVIRKPKWSRWEMESSVRIDNGYGGNVHTVSSQGDDFIEVARDFLKKVDESDSRYNSNYM